MFNMQSFQMKKHHEDGILLQISDSQERIKCKQTHQKSFIQTCITVNYLKKNDPQNRYRYNKSCQIPIYKKIHKLIRLNFSIYKQYWKKQQSKKKLVETKSIFSQISFNSLNIKFVLNRNLNYFQLEELSFNLQYFYEDNSLEDENYEFEYLYNQLGEIPFNLSFLNDDNNLEYENYEFEYSSIQLDEITFNLNDDNNLEGENYNYENSNQLEEILFNLQYFNVGNNFEDGNQIFEYSYNQLEVTLYSPQYITEEKSLDFFLNFQTDIPFNLFISDIDESKGLNEEDDKKEDEDDKKEDEAEKCISQIE